MKEAQLAFFMAASEPAALEQARVRAEELIRSFFVNMSSGAENRFCSFGETHRWLGLETVSEHCSLRSFTKCAEEPENRPPPGAFKTGHS